MNYNLINNQSMKKTWYRLAPEEAVKIYCVPENTANDPNNYFWGLTYQYPQELFEGDWPLVALLHNEQHQFAITLKVRTLPMELIHDSEFEHESQHYNSLDESRAGGYLHLSIEQSEQLCNILKTQTPLIITNTEPIVTTQPVFQLLNNNEIQQYRLHPEWLPGVQKSYYIQVDHAKSSIEQSTISIIAVYASVKLSFEIMSFEKEELLNETFTPLSHSRPQLDLDWPALLELINILSLAVKQEAEFEERDKLES